MQGGNPTSSLFVACQPASCKFAHRKARHVMLCLCVSAPSTQAAVPVRYTVSALWHISVGACCHLQAVVGSNQLLCACYWPISATKCIWSIVLRGQRGLVVGGGFGFTPVFAHLAVST